MMRKSSILALASLAILLVIVAAGCVRASALFPITTSTPESKPTTSLLYIPHLNADSSPKSALAYPDPSIQATVENNNPNSPDYPSASATEPGAFLPADTATPIPTDTPPGDTSTPSLTPKPGKPPTPTLFWPTPNPVETATPYPRPANDKGQSLPPDKWQEWPVIPVVSQRARQIYQAGVDQNHDTRRFSKVGDCQNIRQYFLGMFDNSKTYNLGDQYSYLKGAIDQFSGSWNRLSESVRTGFNVASVLTPLYSNPNDCKGGESPIACEFRIWNPSIVIISMETWTAGRPTALYETYLRQIVEFAISQNVLPIVATKADNLEGDNSINRIVAQVATDYDIPMWNFWAAAHPLPDHGLLEDGFHLTNASNWFDKSDSMDKAWPWRNLTALQVIDKVWRAVK
jgi:hypothetical protein